LTEFTILYFLIAQVTIKCTQYKVTFTVNDNIRFNVEKYTYMYIYTSTFKLN